MNFGSRVANNKPKTIGKRAIDHVKKPRRADGLRYAGKKMGLFRIKYRDAVIYVWMTKKKYSSKGMDQIVAITLFPG